MRNTNKIDIANNLKAKFKEFFQDGGKRTRKTRYPQFLIIDSVEAFNMGFTQLELSEITGATRETISKWIKKSNQLSNKKNTNIPKRLNVVDQHEKTVNPSDLAEIYLKSGAIIKIKVNNISLELLTCLNQENSIC